MIADLADHAPRDLPDVLARICAQTRAEVERRSGGLPLHEIRLRLRDLAEPPRGFGSALKRKAAERQAGLIAEIKRASPSAGLIRPTYDPAAIAREYQAAGAACLSVLTEASAFGGHVADLQIARAAVRLPVLRKDFILGPWQVYESRLIGADCILLIMAALTDAVAAELLELARSLGLDVLVEVHDDAELDRALALDTALIGINNRDLRTLRTDLDTTVRLAPRVPPGRIVVAESGIRTRADVVRLGEAGASCFLVGEALLRQPDAGAASRRPAGAGLRWPHPSSGTPRLSHLDEAGRAVMVDVSDKPVTAREAVAAARVAMRPETLARIAAGTMGKGGRLRDGPDRWHHGRQAHRRPDPRSATRCRSARSCWRSRPTTGAAAC